MYAVNVEEHSRWRSITNRAQRLWVRTWIDSVHVGTHIHWQLSPLSILGLAHLWEYMNRQQPHHTRRQRSSIKAMARRRQTEPGYLGSMPHFDDHDSAWDAFFNQQIVAHDEIRQRLVQWHLTALSECKDIPLLHRHLNALFGALVLSGPTNDQLFRAVCKGVLDPQNLGGQTPSENLRDWLESYLNPRSTEFLAYTKAVPITPDPISRRLRLKWSSVKLPNLDAFSSARTLPTLVGGDLEPYIVTRRAVLGGIAELHRREARRVYALRIQKFPGLSVFVLAPRSYFRPIAPEASEKYHDINFKRTEVSIDASGDEEGAILFQKAAQELFDSPEEAIRNLLVGAELRWRQGTIRQTDQLLANAYRWRLRSRLSEDFANYLSRVRAIGKDPRVPEMSALSRMAEWDWEAEKDFLLLLKRLAYSSHIDDELLLFRLRELTDWYSTKARPENELMGLANTWREIDDLLTIIRGVRNSATHFAAADETLYGAMLYLAKVLFEAFAAAWVRDAAEETPSEEAAGTPANGTEAVEEAGDE
jgi:hypothetical protein